jgi:hypothetical protein
MSDEPKKEEDEKPISITQIHIPIMITIGASVVLGTSLLSIAATWYRVSAHSEDKVVHASSSEAVQGGGIAFKNEIQTVRSALEEKIREDGKKTRKAVGSMRINCSGRPGGDLRCTTSIENYE